MTCANVAQDISVFLISYNKNAHFANEKLNFLSIFSFVISEVCGAFQLPTLTFQIQHKTIDKFQMISILDSQFFLSFELSVLFSSEKCML